MGADVIDSLAPKELIVPEVTEAGTYPAISGALFISGGHLYFCRDGTNCEAFSGALTR